MRRGESCVIVTDAERAWYAQDQPPHFQQYSFGAALQFGLLVTP